MHDTLLSKTGTHTQAILLYCQEGSVEICIKDLWNKFQELGLIYAKST